MHLHLPAIPRLLEILLAAPEGVTEAFLRSVFDSSVNLCSAIDLLAEKGIISRDNSLVRLSVTGKTADIVKKLLVFYDVLDRTVRKTLLVRGILSMPGCRCLVRRVTLFQVAEAEGFSGPEISQVLSREREAGFITEEEVVYRLKPEGTTFFSFIPYNEYPYFKAVNAQYRIRFRKGLSEVGLPFVKENYLLSSYPEKIAFESTRYLKHEKRQLSSMINSQINEVYWSRQRLM